MKIAYYLDSDDPVLCACADRAVASARQHMPDAEIIQLAGRGGSFVERRLMAHSEIEDECIFIDVDVIFRADVSAVFEREFDVAIPTDTMPGTPNIRFDGGVTFCRNPSVWHQLNDAIGHLDFRQQAGDWQPIMEAQTRFFEERRFKTLVLPGREYCRVPVTQDDTEGAKIMHYRGPRKEWM